MSDRILDADGVELLYWPLGALKAGEDSAELEIQVLCGEGMTLAGQENDLVTVFASSTGSDPFTDISATPFDLSPWTGYHTFTIYLHASEDVEAFIRVPLTVGVVGHSPANWQG